MDDLRKEPFVDSIYSRDELFHGRNIKKAPDILMFLKKGFFPFGYAFDIGLNSIVKHSYGTHEFTFIAKFGENARRYRWLNRF